MRRQPVAIHVTDKHIAEGFVMDCRNCPIALAIAELLKPGYVVTVHVERASFINTNKDGFPTIYHATLPNEASDFIRRFDEKEIDNPQPLDFDLDLPTCILKEAA